MNPGPGFAEILVFMTNIDGHRCQNAMGYSIDPGVDQTTADAVSDALAVPYKAQLSANSFFNGVRIIVGADGPESEFDSVSSAGVGGRSGDFESPMVQGLIRKSTAFAGRKYRGRMYIPDMADSTVDYNGNVNTTGRTLLQGIADQWMTLNAIDALLLLPQLLHTAEVLAPTEVTSLLVENKVATQRRRYNR
jgi:hypothetical protein